ncbi:MAG TPA: ADP-ribosylglycohydrolase family protein [Solirubrobacteraceae bacterium]
MTLPADYAERVYAGVLGKIIGVYLGRPFEQWTHREIEERLGEIRGYVTGHPAIEPGKRENPLVVSDDDISGTFTFLRALDDYGPGVTAEQIGQTWLNYVVEERSTHWWGGVGVSAEHTAYLRLKDGLRAPRSGSAAVNGKVLSEQIGAQIFIDGWAMACPGDPERAADLARRAATVSHDGEAVLAAQVVAALEAQAFVESDIDALLDGAVSLIPRESVIFRAIDDIRGWHAGEPDWRHTRERIEERYGYDRYRGICHVVPNHALIVHALLHGAGDFDRSLTIVNTSGWDTDCNSGNLGCLLGIRNGPAGIAPRWREPVADRLYLSSADGGRSITDAASEAVRVVNAGRALAGELPWAPGGGARFHFSLPGSVQGFEGAVVHVDRALAIDGVAVTPTFVPPEAIRMTGYELQACPTLYPGQTVRVDIEGAQFRLLTRVYDESDALTTLYGPEGASEWRVPDTGGQPIAQVGVEASGPARLHWLTWDGAPDVTLTRPAAGGAMWRRAWVRGVDRFDAHWPEPFRLIQDRDRGLLIQGTREWEDYEVAAAVVPETAVAAGIAARVQGLRRYYALLLGADGVARLVRELDGTVALAEAPLARRDYAEPHALELRVTGDRLRASVDGKLVLEARDGALAGGAVALVCEEGCLTCDAVRVRPPC